MAQLAQGLSAVGDTDLMRSVFVYYYFRKWSKDSAWQKVQQGLLEQLGLKQGRKAKPSLGIIDSQTVKTSRLADQETVGINGHRWIKGRKRHLLVEVNGHLLSVALQPANLPDEIGAWSVIRPVKGLSKILADQGYDNDLLKDLCQAVHQSQLEIVRKQQDQKGFVVQPKRWVVERVDLIRSTSCLAWRKTKTQSRL